MELLDANMTTTEAITKLREMQSQIIHGSNTFGDIADTIAALEAENIRRIRHLNRLATWAQQDPTGPLPEWRGAQVQSWVLNEIRAALGSNPAPQPWTPECLQASNTKVSNALAAE